MKTLTEIQQEMIPWVEHNFGQRGDWQAVMGAAEEVGELCHHVLKRHQNIRTNEDHDEEEKDAVGDIVVYLMDFCNARNYNLEVIVNEVWNKVSKRDWKANSKDGITESAP